jgi:autotransporter adhesin
VAAGINLTDAVNVGQLSSMTSGFQSQLGGLQSQFAGLQSQVIYNQREARSGVASALAASNLHYDQRPGKASFALAFGNFKGQSALAGGFGYAVSDRWRVNASFTASPDQGDFGAAVGTSWTLN